MTKVQTAKIKAKIEQYPQYTNYQIVERVKSRTWCPKSAQVAHIRAEMGLEPATKPGTHDRSKPKATTKAIEPVQRRTVKRRTLTQLRDKYDRSYLIPKAIEEVIAKYITGGGWLYDTEMLEEVCQRVPKSRQRWAQYRDREEYAEYQTRIDDKVIWVDPAERESVERMRAT